MKEERENKVKIKIETYGCTANKNHSQIMAGLLKDHYELVGDDSADLIVLNTCSVKGPTENKILYRIKQLQSQRKNVRFLIAGCMPLSEPDVVRKIDKDAVMVGPHNCADIKAAVEYALKNKTVEFVDMRTESKLNLPKYDLHKKEEYIIEISQGCTGACSFCSTKFAKGPLRSYPPEEIIREFHRGLEKGFKEFHITSQDNACYGIDLKTDLVALLKGLLDTVDQTLDFKIRLGMMNPDNAKRILPGLVEVMKSDKIRNFLHIPLQSGSNKVLKDMRRKYTVEEFKRMVSYIRKEIPYMIISTDVIIGFPTETESDFNETLKVIKETRPQVINVSKYCPRPHTEAKKLKNIDSKIIDKRSRRFHNILASIRKSGIQKFSDPLSTCPSF